MHKVHPPNMAPLSSTTQGDESKLRSPRAGLRWLLDILAFKSTQVPVLAQNPVEVNQQSVPMSLGFKLNGLGSYATNRQGAVRA
jgi:hypothetical protein